MAEITFIGAAGTVTGSKHLLTSLGHHVLIDCGLFQGTHDVVALNNVPLPIPPKQLEAVIITHGHIDHVGYLPKLVHDGFRGTIYATPPTRALIDIVLEDALNLQTHLRERGLHEEHYAPPPFYNQADVERVMQMTKVIELETPFSVAGMSAVYRNAAHIIGSAFVELTLEGGKRIVFSGDLGRYNRELLYDPQPIGNADALICESTYGDRVHPPDALDALKQTLEAGIARGGAIVIPAFAVERTQEILLSIGQLQTQDGTIGAVPVYMDSPMAAQVDDLFHNFPTAHKPLPDTNGKPFGCGNLTVAVSTEQSKAINRVRGPHIIVSASGMAAGGRVLHHLYNNVSDPKATVLFVGFQSMGTLGFFLTHGAPTIKIFGDQLPVHANVGIIHGYSAHADRNEIAQWLDTCDSKPVMYAVHGDPVSAQALCDLVRAKYNWVANVAARGTTVSV